MSRVTGKSGQLNLSTVSYERREGYAVLAINRPAQLNSLNLVCFREMTLALREAAWDDNVGAVIITGTGDKAFCAGADLKEHKDLCIRPRDYYPWIREFIHLQTQIVNLGKPTVAKLNGLVIGAGNELNLACDLAIAADDVIIRQAGTAVGSVAAIGVTQWLPLAIGDRRARAALLLCEDILAEDAKRWGLVNEVVPRSELDEAAAVLARKLVDKFPEVTRHTLTQVNFWKNLVWGVTSPHAADWLAIHSSSTETFEGMSAFEGKRPVDRASLRRRAVNDQFPEFHNGAPLLSCRCCGASGLPALHKYCGQCGAPLDGLAHG